MDEIKEFIISRLLYEDYESLVIFTRNSSIARIYEEEREQH